ncbi:hypothetical protein [Methylosinus sp. RM1]|uniref:hypothetical protein n=1 Tax=Methylosinus sp. RM1 TaxID=2583817 RepID=UPI00140DECF9|nr:hypothetical protein [Methylosinus sp. RM1]
MMRAFSSTGNSGRNDVRVAIVTTYEELLHALMVRGICFVEEHGVAAGQTYDGNDYQATHIVAYAGEEPIASARVRWFRDFAKMERSCVRKQYRSPRILKYFSHFIYDHVARKGYDRLLTHAKPEYAEMWCRLLGLERTAKEPLYFDEEAEPYVELVKRLTPHADPIRDTASIATLFRVEGEWDAPSRYERVDG